MMLFKHEFAADRLKFTKAYWAHFRTEKNYIFRELTRNFRELTRNFRE